MAIKRKRRYERIVWRGNNSFTPEYDEEARVLAGRITHKTGTNTLLQLVDKGETADIFTNFFVAPSGLADDVINLNPIELLSGLCTCGTSLTPDVWFNHKIQLKFTVGTGGIARLLLEIVKVDEETGEHLA